ncbi:MAG: CFI-box-CTERM domain-containing protein, partial [Nitrosopumilaceae archaeon]|nr:CFI-box-CTERM domain-containing protein [Nitrosopumilaceae archaeon]
HSGKSIDDYLQEQKEKLQPSIDEGNIVVISNNKKSIDGKPALETNANGFFKTQDGLDIEVQFRQTTIRAADNFYIFSYSNDKNFFDRYLPNFEETLNSFELTNEEKGIQEIISDNPLEQVSEGGGCLIATAAYGSELAPQVQMLREIRDTQLMNTASGAAFMTGFNQLYYSFSPTIADIERENPTFKEFVKLAITPMLSTLSIMTHADSEYEVLGYGISLIILNLGMYVGMPVAVIIGIRRARV